MDKKALASEQTKKALKSSFLELCEKNGLSGVTVGAITKKAGYGNKAIRCAGVGSGSYYIYEKTII